MKKPHSYHILSNKTCKTCGKKLKLNLTINNPDAEYCYIHWVQAKGLQGRRESFRA